MPPPENAPPSAGERPKRILSLDGGGIRGVFTLQVLARVEALFREQRGDPKRVLAQEFDLIAGTSTGAIIATMLAWGMEVAEIERRYLEESERMFTKVAFNRRWKAKFDPEAITLFFQRLFSEKGDGADPVTLDTDRLRTLLLLVMRNATTGSPWPVTNNPKAKYSDRSRTNCNLNVELWKLVRASTAAPTYFPPEKITFGQSDFLFVDGGITPYNNPAFIAFLTATLPCFHLNWPTGVDRLHLLSVGTCRYRTRLTKTRPEDINWLDSVKQVVPALLDSIAVEQDLACRVLGRCIYGGGREPAARPPAPKDRIDDDEIDTEIGALTGDDGVLAPAERKFTYVRYNHRFSKQEEEELRSGETDDPFALDNIPLIPTLQQLGRNYAQRVRPEHLFPAGGAPRAPAP